MSQQVHGRTTPEHDFERWRRHGDAAALGRVFDRLAPELLLVAAHFADRGAAEDLVQATFVAAITDAARWQAERPLMPWLVGIVANLARRERERASRRVDAERLTANTPDDPRAIAEREETNRLLASALRGMPRHYRQVLTLRLVHGLEPLAIAHALGSPPATIKSRLQRGMAMLQRALPAGLRAPAVAALSFPSLAAVRTAVLAHGKAHVLAGSGAAASAALVTGGMLLMKKFTLAAAVVLATAAILTVPSWWDHQDATAPEPAAPMDVPAADSVRLAQRPEAEVMPTREAVPAPATNGEAPAVAVPVVRGRVVDEAGRPLADIGVYLGDKSVQMFETTAQFLGRAAFSGPDGEAQHAKAQIGRTAADGSFALALPPNDHPHLLVAYSAARGCRGLDLPADPTAIEIVLPVDPVLTGIVRGRIDQQPVAGARINCWPAASGYPIEFRHSDEQGRFQFQPLPAGSYRLGIDAEGFAEGKADFGLLTGEVPATLQIELEPLPPIDLLFVDAADQAWTPARIGGEIGVKAPKLVALISERPYQRREETIAETWASYRLQLDDDGHLRGFRSLEDAGVFSLWSGGEKLFEVLEVDVRADRLAAPMLERRTIALQVGITFAPNAPAPRDVHLAVTDPSGFATRLEPLVERDTTGQLCVLPVPAQFVGSECGLLAESAGCAPFFTVVPIPAQADGTWQQVVLSPGTGRLTGVVVGEDGKPLTNVRLQLADPDGHWFVPPALARRRGDLDGTFEFSGLPPRPARLLVSAPEHAARGFDVDPRRPERLRLELRRGRDVVIRTPAGTTAQCAVVRDGSGRPLQDDRLGGTKRYGELSVRADVEAETVEVFDGATGECVGAGRIPADGSPLVLQR
ncbi:MAG: sigma-70 family RNA polymerase sigma factor [Planctomycetes bacterium]|nr:sigma-70 family RNA polymerase sigma factor [Planctomycetota bacterium]